MTTHLCVRCNKPMGDVAAFDPRGTHRQGEGPRYMHGPCRLAELADMELERRQVALAAPKLLEACEAALDYVRPDAAAEEVKAYDGPASRLKRKLVIALARAKGD